MTQPHTPPTAGRTAAATRARMWAREQRMAAELVARGWTCHPPAGRPTTATSSAPAVVDLVAVVRPASATDTRVTIVGPPCRDSKPRANLDQLGEHLRASFIVPATPVPRRADSPHQLGPFVELLAAQGYDVTGSWVVGVDVDGGRRAHAPVREVAR